MLVGEAAEKAAGKYRSYRKSGAWKTHLKRFVALWGGRPVDSLTFDEVDDWSLARRNECAAATLVAELVALKAIFKAARVAWHQGLTGIKVNNQRVSQCSEAQEAKLKARMAPKDFDLVRFAILTGVRRIEQFRLRVSEVEWNSKSIHIAESKTGYGRSVGILPEALEILRRHAKGKAPDAYVFCHSERGSRLSVACHFVRQLRGLMDGVLGEAFQWRDFRHTFASRLATRGAALYHVQSLMGHKNPKTTQRYAHLSAKDLRNTLTLLT